MAKVDTQEGKINTHYKGIDLVKFIMAILIVTIHAQPFTSVNENLNQIVVDCIARLAVPFFFISSGFLLFRKEGNEWNHVKRYCLRMLKLYLIWTLIYLPLNLYECVVSKQMHLWDAVPDIARRTVLSGSYMQLWYFPAVIVAVLLVALCVRCKIKDGVMLLIGSILYILGLSYQAWYGYFIQLPFMQMEKVAGIINGLFEMMITTRNGVFFGFFFVVLGRLFAKGKIMLPFKGAVVGLIGCLLWGVGETRYLLKTRIAWERDMWMFLPFATLFLFAIACQIKPAVDSQRCKALRQAGVVIFLVHVGYEVMYRAVIVKLVGGVYHSLAAFGFVLLMSLVTAWGVQMLEQKKLFKWLGKLLT